VPVGGALLVLYFLAEASRPPVRGAAPGHAELRGERRWRDAVLIGPHTLFAGAGGARRKAPDEDGHDVDDDRDVGGYDAGCDDA
jgi:hypothetical protein